MHPNYLKEERENTDKNEHKSHRLSQKICNNLLGGKLRSKKSLNFTKKNSVFLRTLFDNYVTPLASTARSHRTLLFL